MKKRLKNILIILVLIFLIFLFYLYFFHSYRYNSSSVLDYDHDGIINQEDNDIDGDGIQNLVDNDADGDGIDNIEDIVSNARKMEGTLYDYSQGKYDNLAGKLGFLVCVDIPKISYAEAGIYFEQILSEDFNKHSNLYDTEDGINTPSTSFFYRRTRNYYRYFELNNKLIKNCESPKVGDLVFYGKDHIALVSEVHDDGTYNEIETAPWTIFAVEHKNKKWENRDVGRILGK